MNQWIIVIVVGIALFVMLRPKAPAAARMNPAQLKEALATQKDAQLIDVRTPAEFSSGHLAGAKNIPVSEFTSRLNELKADKPLLLYCHSGNRSGTALSIALKNGFPQAKHLEGGISAWQGAGFPVTR